VPPDARECIVFDGGEPAAGPPSAFRALLASDLAKWSKITRERRRCRRSRSALQVLYDAARTQCLPASMDDASD